MTAATTDVRPPSPPAVRERTSSSLRRWAAPVAAVAVLLFVHVFAATGANIPLYWEDEAGYLGNGLVLSGLTDGLELRGRPYYIGWSILIAPLWLIFQDGQATYLAAVWVSAACGAATAIPLTAVARRLGLSLPWAIVAGSVIAMSPARTVFSGMALSENLLALLVACTVWFAVRLRDRPTWPNALGLGLFAAGAFATHGRAIPLVVAAGLWFVLHLRRRPIVALAGLVPMGLTALGSFLLYRSVAAQLYQDASAREDSGIGRIFNSDLLPTFLSGFGQFWYLVFAWLGLAVIGILVLGRAAWREVRRRTPGLATWGLIALIGAAIICFPFNAPTIARAASRIDVYSYGRYLDPFVVPLALIGLVLVIRGLSKRMAIATLSITAATGAVWYAVVWPVIPSEGKMWWAPMNVAALLQFPWRGTTNMISAFWEPWLLVTAVVLGALVVVLLLRRRPVVLVVLLAAYFAVSSVSVEVRFIRPFFSTWNASFTLRDELLHDPELAGSSVSFDMNGIKEIDDVVSKNAYQILLAPRPVDIIDTTIERPATDLVIARQDWNRADDFGALKLDDDEGVFQNALWVMPGELQDVLISEGRLSPTAAPAG
jgi:hypothetical protein